MKIDNTNQAKQVVLHQNNITENNTRSSNNSLSKTLTIDNDTTIYNPIVLYKVFDNNLSKLVLNKLFQAFNLSKPENKQTVLNKFNSIGNKSQQELASFIDNILVPYLRHNWTLINPQLAYTIEKPVQNLVKQHTDKIACLSASSISDFLEIVFLKIKNASSSIDSRTLIMATIAVFMSNITVAAGKGSGISDFIGLFLDEDNSIFEDECDFSTYNRTSGIATCYPEESSASPNNSAPVMFAVLVSACILLALTLPVLDLNNKSSDTIAINADKHNNNKDNNDLKNKIEELA